MKNDTMTLLRQTLHPDNLRRAWDDVADNNGCPGVDNVTVNQWRRNWEERLTNLAHTVRANQYKPGRLRIRRIPKRHAPDKRILRIPTITDRVLQRAVLQRLQPVFNPRFLHCSFGYRPGLGVKDAVRYITRQRQQGYTFVLDADIDDFFNQIDHALLRQFLREDLLDHSLLPLIDLWLNSWRVSPENARGIPMGSPLSPLLSNIYLHRLDKRLLNHGLRLARFADDFIVLSGAPPDWRLSYTQTEAALAALKLKLEPRKTSLTSFEDGFEFLGVHFEETWYWYTWDNKHIEIHGDQKDPFINNYDPFY
jgi:CRISPR-associated protein Cas1